MAGFERRLNDVTCSGCHQTRGIGGFHFPGVDWMAAKPSNSTVVPASPHFFGDQIRRRDILHLARGKPGLFARLFQRPQLRGGISELKGTGHYDGWGAHCYEQGKPPPTMTEFSQLDLRRGARLRGRRQDLADRHVLRQEPLNVLANLLQIGSELALCAPPKGLCEIAGRIGAAMRSPDQDKARNREIAENEAERQTTGDIRVSAWAIAVAVAYRASPLSAGCCSRQQVTAQA